MNYGDLGKRIAAYFIDGIILWLIGFILGYFLGLAGVIISPVVGVLYWVLMEGGSWHATLGKRIMNLYIADAYGNGISYSTSILRGIGKFLSGLILGIGYIIALFNDEKQGLHDMLARTYVLNGKAEYAKGEHQLVGITGPLAGRVFPITGEGINIGRDSVSCRAVVPASQTRVSRVHSFVTFNSMSGMFILSDRNSTHGTFLANGTRVSYTQPMALRSGDRFYLATQDNTFEVR